MDQAMAVKRLLAEYRSLTENPPDGVTAGPVDEGTSRRPARLGGCLVG